MEDLALMVAEGMGAFLSGVILAVFIFGAMFWGFWKVLDLLFKHPERKPIDFVLPGLAILVGLLTLFWPS